jgi:tRNA (guanine37-N1)-methyltransferase
MNFTAVTIFPEIFGCFVKCGIIGKAVTEGKISFKTVNIRDFAEGRHRITDDRPFGGGSGMVMKPQPLLKAVESVKKEGSVTILLSPQGQVFNQKIAETLSKQENLILICGRYEGIDERAVSYIDFELSIGDYVITGGETAAMAVTEAVVRLMPGVLGNIDSAESDSFSGRLLKHAQYTRPRDFNGMTVPEILLSGDHKKIEKWRIESSLKHTFLKRPDILENIKLSEQELEILEKWQKRLAQITGRLFMFPLFIILWSIERGML